MGRYTWLLTMGRSGIPLTFPRFGGSTIRPKRDRPGEGDSNGALNEDLFSLGSHLRDIHGFRECTSLSREVNFFHQLGRWDMMVSLDAHC